MVQCFKAAVVELVTERYMKQQVLPTVKSMLISDISTGERMDIMDLEVYRKYEQQGRINCSESLQKVRQ